MNNRNSKLAAILIAALMLVSIGTVLISGTGAAVTYANKTYTTFAYITTMPHNIGVGQTVTVYFWVNQIFPGASMYGGNTMRFEDWTIKITKPDNTTETKTFDKIMDTTSNQAYGYTPTQTGTYTVEFSFPETWVNKTSSFDPNATTANDIYKACSATTTFTVQQDPIYTYPDSYALPTEYWSRPIYGENPYWFVVSSNWLGTGAAGYQFMSGTNYGGNGQQFPSDAVGSMTSHVMWTKALQSGGVVGGDNYEIYGNTYFDGSAYLVRYQNPIIVNGHIYYTEPLGYAAGTGGDTVCVDLQTGKEIWRSSTMGVLSHAIIADWENGNQHGVSNALLVATSGGGFFGGPITWKFYDADTGKFLYNVTGIPSGMKAVDTPNGEYIQYTTSTNATGSYVSQWNTTKLWDFSSTTPTITTGSTGSTANRYDWMNQPITYNGQMYTNTSYRVLYAESGDYMLCMNGTFPSTGLNMFFGATETYKDYTYFLVNLNSTKADLGKVLWMNTVSDPTNTTVVFSGVDDTNRVFVEGSREGLYWTGYSIDNGKQLWTTDDYPQTDMDYYGSQASGSLSNSFYNGKMYSAAYAGIVYCYDTTDGSLLWTYGNGGVGNSTDSGLQVPGNYPTFVAGYGQDVVYTVTSEHTIETPLYKGALQRALNATTGQEIWTISGYTNQFMGTAYALADGYNTWFNGLDNSIYVVGKGPSTMTVTAPNAGLDFGQKVVIRGTVTDVSSGASQSEQAARFVNGLPVASDASMTEWMGYVYQDKPAPTNFTGVPVAISVVDANGNYRTIGTTTTDITGMYSLSWTPDIAGDYTVIATFAGTNGYWGTTSRSTFTVDEAKATATPMPTQAPSAADLYFLPAIAALLVAVIVAIAMIALVLMKKP